MAKRGIGVKNWNWTKQGFQRELSGLELKGQTSKVVIAAMSRAQEDFLKSLPNTEAPSMPFITGNLHDSIAGVVTNKGRVVKASYTDPVATHPSEITGKEVYTPTSGMGRKQIIGSLTARTALRNMQGKYPTAIAATMIIGVPYAETPQERGPHAGYMDVLAVRYAEAMKYAINFGKLWGAGGGVVGSKFWSKYTKSK